MSSLPTLLIPAGLVRIIVGFFKGNWAGVGSLRGATGALAGTGGAVGAWASALTINLLTTPAAAGSSLLFLRWVGRCGGARAGEAFAHFKTRCRSLPVP